MGSLKRKLTRDELADEFNRKVAAALREAEPGSRLVIMDTGADPARLRGIPAIGRSVTGAIRGTDPERAALR